MGRAETLATGKTSNRVGLAALRIRPRCPEFAIQAVFSALLFGPAIRHRLLLDEGHSEADIQRAEPRSVRLVVRGGGAVYRESAAIACNMNRRRFRSVRIARSSRVNTVKGVTGSIGGPFSSGARSGKLWTPLSCPQARPAAATSAPPLGGLGGIVLVGPGARKMSSEADSTPPSREPFNGEETIVASSPLLRSNPCSKRT